MATKCEIILELTLRSDVALPPGSVDLFHVSRWLHFNPNLMVPAVVLRVIGVVADHILVANLKTEPLHDIRQVRQLVNPDGSPTGLIGKLLQIARALEQADCPDADIG